MWSAVGIGDRVIGMSSCFKGSHQIFFFGWWTLPRLACAGLPQAAPVSRRELSGTAALGGSDSWRLPGRGALARWSVPSHGPNFRRRVRNRGRQVRARMGKCGGAPRAFRHEGHQDQEGHEEELWRESREKRRGASLAMT